jgi:uncharacterized OB-fold protein
MTEFQGAATVAVEAPELLPYLAAAAEGHLVLPRCHACGRLQFPPRPTCRYCRHAAFDWVETPLAGSVYSWTVTHRSPVPSLAYAVPYAVVVVALDGADTVRLVGRLEDYRDGRDILPGQRVVGRFTTAAATEPYDYPVLVWQLVNDSAPPHRSIERAVGTD